MMDNDVRPALPTQADFKFNRTITMLKTTLNLLLALIAAICVVCSTTPKQPKVETPQPTINFKPVRIEMRSPTAACQAETNLSYWQLNTKIRIETEIKTSGCDSNRGEQTVQVRFDDEHDETKLVEFTETWPFSKESVIKAVNEYEIGEGITVRRVRIVKTQCWCEDAEADLSDK